MTFEENVLMQIASLQTHPAVAVALAEGKLKLHGFVGLFAPACERLPLRDRQWAAGAPEFGGKRQTLRRGH